MRPWKRMRNSRRTAKPCKPACKRQDEDALDLRPRRHPAGDTAAGLRPHQSSSVTVNGLEWNGMEWNGHSSRQLFHVQACGTDARARGLTHAE